MDALQITQQLVAIPSHRNAIFPDGIFEHGVALFIKSFCAKELPNFILEEQEVKDGRRNIFIRGADTPDLLLIAHMDTVDDGVGWTTNVRGEIKNDRLYGRGSADMKSGIAVALKTLQHAHKKGMQNISALFYCDEEYEFLGMRAFAQTYKTVLSPALIVSLEPTHNRVRCGCRGIIEIQCAIKGKRAHAARPASGASAFFGLLEAINHLQIVCDQSAHLRFGQPSINVTGVRCGTMKTEKEGAVIDTIVVGNVIPDYCEARIEIRTVPDITLERVRGAVEKAVREAGCVLSMFGVIVNLGSFFTERARLTEVERIQQGVFGGESYDDIESGGYSDIQMLAEQWHSPAILWGASGGNMHGADEYVEKVSVAKLTDAYRQLVDKMGKPQV